MSRGDMKQLRRVRLTVSAERAVLVAGVLPGEIEPEEEPLAELRRLAETAGAAVVGELVQKLRAPAPRTFIGKGKVAELKRLAAGLDARTAIFDNELTPAQLGNIEKATGLKTVDRAELILGIFASRARSRQAKLQVGLAQMEYLLPRLPRMWSHLERQTGGIGVRGGPGERQIEVDRRQIRRRIKSLKDTLGEISERRERTVASRDDSYNVSLIGYTNAGKSTLLNALTDADAFVEDRLFATLETKTKRLKLEGGYKVLLSDTVGFIRRLPHDLIESFHATLEEARTADLLVHVVDGSAPAAAREMAAVDGVLSELGIAETDRLVVFNKLDAVADRALLRRMMELHPGSVAISARTGEGLAGLRQAVTEHAAGGSDSVHLSVHAADGRALSYIAQHGFETSRSYDGDRIEITARMKAGTLEYLLGEYPSVERASV